MIVLVREVIFRVEERSKQSSEGLKITETYLSDHRDITETSQRHIFFSWYILTVFGIKYHLNYLVIPVICDFLTISEDN